MLDRVAVGELPAKPHLALRGSDGSLRYEHCLTRDGFRGAYSISYHLNRPHVHSPADLSYGWKAPITASEVGLEKRHLRTLEVAGSDGAPVNSRVPLLFNHDLVISVVRPSESDPVYLQNADADDLYFVLEGGGVLRSSFGDLRFETHDYLCVPKGILHRFILDDETPQFWLSMACRKNLSLLSQFRNETGQLRMDAPYSHRDFRRPTWTGPVDEGIRELVVHRDRGFFGFRLPHSPLDSVGWDGTVYPWVFPIHRFQPKVGAVHLPPDGHGTFAAQGALICSFIPRLLDFHPDAVPCPYPHTSVDYDEVLFYVAGNFTSRRGVARGSLSHHPAGLTHGPHPGAYEASVAQTRTDEVAVMVDTMRSLSLTPEALTVQDSGYMVSFL